MNPSKTLGFISFLEVAGGQRNNAESSDCRTDAVVQDRQPDARDCSGETSI